MDDPTSLPPKFYKEAYLRYARETMKLRAEIRSLNESLRAAKIREAILLDKLDSQYRQVSFENELRSFAHRYQIAQEIVYREVFKCLDMLSKELRWGVAKR